MSFDFAHSTTTAASPFSFGSNTFGAASTNQGGLTLGAPAPASTGGFTFGASSTTQPAAPATGGFSFGSQPAAPATGGLTFGAAPVSAAPSLNFGLKPTAVASPIKPAAATTTAAQLSFFNTPPASTAAPAATSTAGGLSFGLNAQTPLTFNTLGTTSSGPSFIGSTTSQAPPKLNFLGASTTGTTTATTGTTGGISFGFNTAKTTASTGLTFNTPTTGSSVLFGVNATTSSTSATVTTTSSTTFKGLGGVDSTTIAGGLPGSTAGGRTENKTVRVNQVPNDIIQSIEGFKSFVKTQKNLSCEVARASAKPLAKVTENTNGLEKLLASLSADLQKNSILVNKLKDDTSKVFAHCEMAQRTHDTPAGLQNDNLAPLEFFMNLVAKFEHSAQVLRQEIDNTEKHVNTLNQPAMLTSQELLMALRRLHESFVALAGRLQLVHQMVSGEKQRHLAMRRHFLKDNTDIFSRPAIDQSAASKRGVGVSTGPTPFSSIGVMHSLTPIAAQESSLVNFGNQSTMGWGSSMPGSSSVPAVGSNSSFQFFSSSSSDNFQLSKPPPGNKRGKR